MIEINLLPGAKKATRGGGGAKFDPAAMLAGISSRVKDRWLVGAIASVVLAVLVVGGLWTYQSSRISKLTDAEEAAVRDSTRFATVVRDRARAEATRDTLLRQLNIIKSIDDDRYIWPHVLDEISRALPPYTWIAGLTFTGTPQGTLLPAATDPKATAAAAAAAADTSKKKAKQKRMDTDVPKEPVQIRVVGQTVDIQALTRFYKDLEASPFLGNVQLVKSELTLVEGGKEVTQFTLDMTYTRPDSTSSAVHRVPLAATVR